MIASGALLAALLGACTGGGGGQSDAAASGGAQSGTQSGTAATSTESSGNTSATPSQDPSGTSTGTGSGGTPACTTADLEVSLTAGGGGGAGSMYPYLVLRNISSDTCTLGGYPGVSFVGDDDGTQLGAPAEREEGTPVQTITLEPRDSAHSELRIVNAGNFDAATCSPQQADGLRVYPPDQTEALFVPTTDYTACTDPDTSIISVQALAPGEG